jgi:hypothetical protein
MDRSTIVRIRKTAEEAVLELLAASKRGPQTPPASATACPPTAEAAHPRLDQRSHTRSTDRKLMNWSQRT